MDLQAYGWNGKIWNGRFGEQKKKGNLIMRKFNLKKIRNDGNWNERNSIRGRSVR